MVIGETAWDEGRTEACRNFPSLEAMDETILENINNNVKTNDYLYMLGDFSLGGIDNIAMYRERIRCRNIHFTFGNHDHHIRRNKIVQTSAGFLNTQSLFTSCSDIIEKKIGKDKFVMCHYPMFSWHKKHGGSIMLFGHCHGNLYQGEFERDRRMDVGIDTHPEFRPYHIDEVRQIMNNKNNL